MRSRGKSPFSDETLMQIGRLKEVYNLDLGACDAHSLREGDAMRITCGSALNC